MSDDTGLPSPRSPAVLTDISATAWEHPADRAALQTLRKIPGFDEVVKRIFGFFGERGIRLMFQANAVRVGPKQFPKLHGLMTEVTTTMDKKGVSFFTIEVENYKQLEDIMGSIKKIKDVLIVERM